MCSAFFYRNNIVMNNSVQYSIKVYYFREESILFLYFNCKKFVFWISDNQLSKNRTPKFEKEERSERVKKEVKSEAHRKPSRELARSAPRCTAELLSLTDDLVCYSLLLASFRHGDLRSPVEHRCPSLIFQHSFRQCSYALFRASLFGQSWSRGETTQASNAWFSEQFAFKREFLPWSEKSISFIKAEE